MLIHIGDAALLDAQAGSNSLRALHAVENLLSAHREGKHIVLLPPSANWLRSDSRISAISRGTAAAVIAKRPEIDGLRKNLAHYIFVGQWGAGAISEQRTSTTVHSVGIDWFVDSSRMQTTIILGENGKDAKIAARFGEAFVHRRRWRIRVAVESRGGGGSTISEEFETACKTRRPVLCIADSDRTCPGSPLGSTAKRVGAIVSHAPFQILWLTECRELENLLPAKVLEGVLSAGGRTMAPDVARYVAMRNEIGGVWQQYLDLKAGFLLFDLRACSNPAEATHLEDVKEQLIKGGISVRCADVTLCKHRAECVCVLVPSLGKDVIGHVVEGSEAVTNAKLGEWSEFESHNELAMLAETAVAFGCAYSESFV